MSVVSVLAPQGARIENRGGIVETLRSRFTKYRLYRRTFTELSALSNRELADLGLTRGELRRVALQAAYDL